MIAFLGMGGGFEGATGRGVYDRGGEEMVKKSLEWKEMLYISVLSGEIYAVAKGDRKSPKYTLRRADAVQFRTGLVPPAVVAAPPFPLAGPAPLVF